MGIRSRVLYVGFSAGRHYISWRDLYKAPRVWYSSMRLTAFGCKQNGFGAWGRGGEDPWGLDSLGSAMVDGRR